MTSGYVCETDNCIEEHKKVAKTFLKNCKTVRI